MGTHPIFESDFDCLTVQSVISRRMTLLAAARKHLTDVDAFIQQTDDAHGSEYTAPVDNRRPQVSGFTGSAGTAVFTREKAALWTDGRYFLQANQELDGDWILMKDGMPGTLSIEEWLIEQLPEGSTIGCDGNCTRYNGYLKMKSAFESKNRKIKLCENPIDKAWTDRPIRPENPLEIMPVTTAGKSWQEKVGAVRAEIQKAGCKGLIITMLDEVAWLFNLRGTDIPFNPLFFSYCYVGVDTIKLFMNPKQATSDVKAHLEGVEICPYGDTTSFLESLKTKTLCSSNSPAAIVNILKSKEVISDTPVSLLKAIKNKTEIEGMLLANVRSAVCHVKLLKWAEDNAGTGVTECDAVDQLASYYAQQKDFRGQSFDTISSSGGTGSIIHYKPKRGSDQQIGHCMYLLDAGCHYSCGTTDTTRAIHCGTPTDFEKECYTLVLMAHVNLAKAIFPEGTRGPALDTLTRAPLWAHGLQFNHGTGHGIGCWLNVHEPPVGLYLSPRKDCVTQCVDLAYKPGYCVTDEPGFYKDGEFGIRIENALYVTEAKTKYALPEGTKFLKFESLCFVPMCRKLIKVEMLDQSQKDWINTYHEQCREKLIPECESQGWTDLIDWIKHNTQPL